MDSADKKSPKKIPRGGRRLVLWIFLLPLLGLNLPAQIGLDRVSAGLMLEHDHVHFDFHIPVLHDPYPHEFQQGYGYDGVDLVAGLRWHWDAARQITRFRLSPGAQDHFGYDQDTDYEPNTTATHGDAGTTSNHTFVFSQWSQLGRLRHWGDWGMEGGFLRQSARYHEILTYDLNSNPLLPSHEYYRSSPERAIIYELRLGLGWRGQIRKPGWSIHSNFNLLPIDQVLLHNYIPEPVATATLAYGFGGGLILQFDLGKWRLKTGIEAKGTNSYTPTHSFNRQLYAFQLAVGR